MPEGSVVVVTLKVCKDCGTVAMQDTPFLQQTSLACPSRHARVVFIPVVVPVP